MTGNTITRLIAMKTMRVKSTTQLVTFITTLWKSSFLTVVWDQHRKCILDLFGDRGNMTTLDLNDLTETINAFFNRR